MNYLHYDLQLADDDVVVVKLDHQANVQLMDEPNFADYQNGRKFRYYGGHVKESPYRLRSPRAGRWHLTVDLGGYPGRVQASVDVEKADHYAVAT